MARFTALLLLAPAVLLATAGAARSQDNELSQEERVAAAEAAYDRGTRAYRARQWADAGRWYERADELLPASAALIQAIRAWGRADDERRAGTVALALLSRHGEEEMARHTTRALRAAEASSLRVDVECTEECALTVDGEAERYRSIFLSPGDEHVLVAAFEDGRREERVSGVAGDRRPVRFDPPPPQEPQTPPDPEPAPPVAVVSPGPPVEVDHPGYQVLPRPVFFVALGLTAVVGGLATWSAIDTRRASKDFDDAPTLAGLREGNRMERRTNVLVGVAAGTAALTAAAAVLTRWRTGGEVRVALVPTPDGVVAVAGGSL